VICFDEFGPLEIRPYTGQNRAKKKQPNRLPAHYCCLHGVKHLLAAYDLKKDKLYGHIMFLSLRSKSDKIIL